jgi:hypothetical protein
MTLRTVVLSVAALCLTGCNCGDPNGGGTGGGSAGGGTSLGGGSGAGGGGAAGGGSGADAGSPDAGCGLGTAASLASPGNLNLFGEIAYFNDAGVLAPGHYAVQYVDGCMKYGGGQDWTIHAYADGHIAWWLVGATSSQRYLEPPGTSGYSVATGAYAAFGDCVAANLLLPPLEFDFDGGVLGVWLLDSPYSDNMAGEGGRNPAWSLSRRGACVVP